MGLFTTKAEWESKVEGLNARIGELETDIVASSETVTAAQNELATANETITGHVAEIGNLTARQSELEAELVAANSALEVSNAAKEAAEKSAGARASEMIAAAGIAAVEVSEGGEKQNTLTAAEFNNLSHPQRNEFIRNGGKLKA